MLTVIGRIVDELGIAFDGHRAWAHPAANFRTLQDPVIAIDLDHDPRQPVGAIEHLERCTGSGLWMVGTLYDDLEITRGATVYASGKIDSRAADGGDAVLLSVALTETPAQISSMPATILKGSIAAGDRGGWVLDGIHAQLVDHAVEQLRERRASRPIRIQDPPAKPERVDGGFFYRGEFHPDPSPWDRQPVGAMRYRAGRILAVR